MWKQAKRPQMDKKSKMWNIDTMKCHLALKKIRKICNMS